MASISVAKVITDGSTVQKVIDVPAGVPFAYASMTATNKGMVGEVLKTWIAPTGSTPGNIDLIEGGVSIDAGGRITDEGILLKQGESFFVQGSGPDLVVRVALMNEIVTA